MKVSLNPQTAALVPYYIASKDTSPPDVKMNTDESSLRFRNVLLNSGAERTRSATSILDRSRRDKGRKQRSSDIQCASSSLHIRFSLYSAPPSLPTCCVYTDCNLNCAAILFKHTFPVTCVTLARLQVPVKQVALIFS
jgi:hypothetical protein